MDRDGNRKHYRGAQYLAGTCIMATSVTEQERRRDNATWIAPEVEMAVHCPVSAVHRDTDIFHWRQT